jgi:hypothetical protein
MLQEIQTKWRAWRESRRQYQLQRALYKAGGGAGRPSAGLDSNNFDSEMAQLFTRVGRGEAPKGKAPD